MSARSAAACSPNSTGDIAEFESDVAEPKYTVISMCSLNSTGDDAEFYGIRHRTLIYSYCNNLIDIEVLTGRPAVVFAEFEADSSNRTDSMSSNLRIQKL